LEKGKTRMKLNLPPKLVEKISLEKGKTRMKLSLPPKLVEKLVWIPSHIFHLVKFSFPVTYTI
jgi:hypothetical protein